MPRLHQMAPGLVAWTQALLLAVPYFWVPPVAAAPKAHTHRISGSVVALDTSFLTAPKPVGGATVRGAGLEKPVVTDAQGKFQVEVTSGATLTLQVDGPGLVPSLQPPFRATDPSRDIVLHAVPIAVDQQSDGIQRTLTGIIGSLEVGVARDLTEGKVLGVVLGDDGKPLIGATVRLESRSPLLARRRAQGNLYVGPAGNVLGYAGFFTMVNVPPGPVKLVTSDFPRSKWAHARYLLDPVETVARPGAVTVVVMRGRPNPWTPAPEPHPAPATFESIDWHQGYVNRSNNTDADASLALGSGLAVGDLDGNGLLDLVCTGGMGFGNGVLLQSSKGRFSLTTMGLEFPGPEKVSIVLGDLDGDGDLDAYQGSLGPDQLFENVGAGHFKDITASSYVSDGGNARSVCMADLDLDGRLDLFCGNYDLGSRIDMDRLDNRGQGNTLHQNLGKFRFREVAGAAGVAQSGLCFSQAFVDLDGDGDDDLVMAHDHGYMKLLLNETVPSTSTSQPSTIRFRDVTKQAGLSLAGSWMGIALGDIDNDGDLDIFVTNTGLAELMYDPVAPERTFTHGLFRNDGVKGGIPRFTEIGMKAGVGDAGWGWGCRFEDLDCDGDLDLVMVTNMFIGAIGSSGTTPSIIGLMPPGGIGGTAGHVFFNDGAGSFWEGTKGAGVNWPDDGRSLVTPDLDGDGYPDLVVGNERGPLVTLRNKGGTNHWIQVMPRGDGQKVNTGAIGAVITAQAAGRKQMRVIQAGDGFKSCSAAIAHFGLGRHSGPVKVTVRWPGGARQVFDDLAVDRIHTLKFDAIGGKESR